MSFLSGNLQQNRPAQVRAVAAWALGTRIAPVRLFDGPATLRPAAPQHLARQYWRVCHNYDNYAGGVDFAVIDSTKAHEDVALTERMPRKLRAGMRPPAGKPRPDPATLQAFATSLETEMDAHAKPNRC